jgi:two-component system LytT family response regulator
MSWRVLIVDDEELARRRIRRFLNSEGGLDLVGECADGKEAVGAIRQHRPDLVFLDVQLPELDGFAVIRSIGVQEMPVVIFVTAHDQHALAAFEAQAVDFLLKPFSEDRFKSAVQRARRYLENEHDPAWRRDLRNLVGRLKDQGKAPDRVMVKSNGRLLFLRFEAIDWVEAMGDYVKLHVSGQSHLLRGRMNEWEMKLPGRSFRRIHRSSIVNLDRIKECVPTFGGEYIVVLTTGARLKASRQGLHNLQKDLPDRL